jgi:DNA invertase Pin-like site-specific DNA recombinase
MAVAERHGWAVVRIFEDAGISGVKGRNDRPGLNALLKAVARREIDMVAAWSVDRLGRSLPDLLDLLRELHSKNVDLFLHQQGLDTSTPSGRAMFSMLGRICRVRARHAARAGLRWLGARQGTGQEAGPAAGVGGESTRHQTGPCIGHGRAADCQRIKSRRRDGSAHSPGNVCSGLATADQTCSWTSLWKTTCARR